MNVNEFKSQRIRSGMFAILPASVRYDVNLSPTCKLLYAEVSACLAADGTCTESNNYFGKILGISTTTVSRYLKKMVNRGYLINEEVDGKRYISMPTQNISFFPPPGSKKGNISIDKDTVKFMEKAISIFEEGIGKKLSRKDQYYPSILSLLETFSREEILEAIHNRVSFVEANREWYKEKNNMSSANNISFVIKDEDALLKWLNTKPQDEGKPIKRLTPFKKDVNKDLLR